MMVSPPPSAPFAATQGQLPLSPLLRTNCPFRRYSGPIAPFAATQYIQLPPPIARYASPSPRSHPYAYISGSYKDGATNDTNLKASYVGRTWANQAPFDANAPGGDS